MVSKWSHRAGGRQMACITAPVMDSCVVMQTTTEEIPMTDPTMALLEATESLERAETEARIADVALSTLVPDAPLCLKVRAVERARPADAELASARATSAAAQD